MRRNSIRSSACSRTAITVVGRSPVWVWVFISRDTSSSHMAAPWSPRVPEWGEVACSPSSYPARRLRRRRPGSRVGGQQAIRFLLDHRIALAGKAFEMRPVEHGDLAAGVANDPQLLQLAR